MTKSHADPQVSTYRRNVHPGTDGSSVRSRLSAIDGKTEPHRHPPSGSAEVPSVRKVVGGTPERSGRSAGWPRPEGGADFDLPLSLETVKEIAKRPLERAGISQFLFHERGRIVEFGYRSHTIAPIFLSPALHLDPRLAGDFARSVVDCSAQLLPPIRTVLERGWQYLSKGEHNLVAVFWHLCRSLVGFELDPQGARAGELLDKMRTPETLLFVIHAQPRGPERILEATETVLAVQPEIRSNRIAAVLVMIRRLLLQDYDLPSLFNVFLTLNMVRLRRFLTINELLAPRLAAVISVAHYAGNETIRGRIADRAERLKQEIRNLEGKLREMGRFRSYFDGNLQGTESYSELLRFYDRGWVDTQRPDFSREYQNVVQFAPRLIRQTDAAFAPLLTGRVRLKYTGVTGVFKRSLFESDIRQLREVEESLERLFFNLRDLPLAKYLAIRNNERGAIPLELEIVRQLEAVRRIFRRTAALMDEALLRSQGRWKRDGFPKSGSESSETEAFVIPHLDDTIESAGPLGGKTVAEAVRYVITISYIIASYLGDRELLEGADRDREVRSRLASLLSNLNRIIGDREYRAFKDTLDVSEELA